MALNQKQINTILQRKFLHWKEIAGLNKPENIPTTRTCYLLARNRAKLLERTVLYPNILAHYGPVFMGLFIVTLADTAGYSHTELLEYARRCGLKVKDLTYIDAALTQAEIQENGSVRKTVC